MPTKTPTTEERKKIILSYVTAHCNYGFNFDKKGIISGNVEPFGIQVFQLCNVHIPYINVRPDLVSILVNPLSKITDVDKIYCYHKHSEYCKYDETQSYCTLLDSANLIIEKEGIKSMSFLASQIDYLRSSSYALPHSGYTVEDLIQCGIFKIKE